MVASYKKQTCPDSCSLKDTGPDGCSYKKQTGPDSSSLQETGSDS